MTAKVPYRQRKLISLQQLKKLKETKAWKGLTGEQRYDYLYACGYYDTEEFMSIFLKQRKTHPFTGMKIKSSPYHKKIDEAYWGKRNAVVKFARAHAKTTRVLANMLKEMLYFPNSDLLYLSSAGLGEESIGKIRLALEETKLIEDVFGRVCPQDEYSGKISKLKKWKQTHLELLNGSSIETLSKGKSIRGRRKKRVVVDDPEEDKDVKSKKRIEDFRDFIFNTVFNVMLEDGVMLVLGTVISDDCFVEYLTKVKKRHTEQYPAVVNKQPIRPEMRSMEGLKKRKHDIGSASFYQEFMHIPITRGSKIIKESWFKYWVSLPGNYDKKVIAVDMAQKLKARNDYTGITCGLVLGDAKYEKRSLQIKLSPLKLETYIVQLYNKEKPDYFVFEDNIETGTIESLKARGIPIKTVHAVTDKWTRLLQVAPQIEFGNVFFNPECEDLRYQLTRFPEVDHDDIMDSFVYFLLDNLQKENRSIRIIGRSQ